MSAEKGDATTSADEGESGSFIQMSFVDWTISISQLASSGHSKVKQLRTAQVNNCARNGAEMETNNSNEPHLNVHKIIRDHQISSF